MHTQPSRQRPHIWQHRKQPAVLAELRSKASTRFLPVCEGDSAVTPGDQPVQQPSLLLSSQHDPDGRPVQWRPALLPYGQVEQHLDAHTGTVFLGLAQEGDAVFAASIEPSAREAVASSSQVR